MRCIDPERIHRKMRDIMTKKKIISKINRIIDNAKFMYNISGWEEDGKIYQAFGEGGFPVRLSQRQANEIAEIFSDFGVSYWLAEPIRINPKATYLLWVNIRAESWMSCNYEYRWGFRRITVSPDDTPNQSSIGEDSEENPTESRRRVRERRIIDIPDL